MRLRAEVGVVYLAGLAQGLALVTFPAVSSILTSPTDYDLSSSAYGALFLPQAIAAVGASLAGARLTDRVGIKRIFLLGLTADIVAMSLLVASQAAMGEPLGYLMLLLATASLGVGFGFTVPSLNSYAAAFFPAAVGKATLYLNALLGLGTALAPLLPLTIGFAELELTIIATSVAGLLIALYQVGYGIAAFGVGPLVASGVGLDSVFMLAAGVALAMGALSFVVVRGRAAVTA